MPLQEFLNNQPIQGNMLEVLVIKTIGSHRFIVGDNSRLALLSVTENPQHAKDIKVGSTIKLLKPIMLDNETLQTNKSFRPIKSRTAIELTPSEEEISRFDTKTEERKVSTNLATFKIIQDN